MKRNELKQQLERELPYSRLTIRADRRIDEILSVLPDRDSHSLENALIPEDWQGFSANGIQVPVEPEKRRPFVTAFKWAGACAAVLLVCLVALNFTAPSLAEQLPGVGGLFQTVNGWFQNREQEVAPPNEIDFLSLPVEDNGVKLLSLGAGEGIGEGSIMAAAQVPFMGRESYSFQDYFNGTPFGTYAVLWVGDQLFLPTETAIEGEMSTKISGNCKARFIGPDEPKNVTWSFSGLPELSQQTVTLAVLEKDWNAESYEGKPLNRVIAEFTLDTDSLRAAATQRYEAGYPGCDPMKKPAPEEILNTQRNDWCISDWYSLAPYAVPESTISDSYRHKAYCKAEFFQRNVETKSISEEFYQPPEWDAVTLNCFVDNRYVCSITARSRSQMEALGQKFFVFDGGFMDVLMGNQKWYETEGGAFCEMVSSGPESCRNLIFGIPATLLGCEDSQEALEAFLKDHEVRLSLVDAQTQQILITDAQTASDMEREAELEAYRSLCAVTAPAPRFSPLPVEDNGTVITAVYFEDTEYDSHLVIEGKVPFMGRDSYNLLEAYETMPLGVNGGIRGLERNEWMRSGFTYVDGCDPEVRAGDNTFDEEPLPDPFPVTWRFDAPEGEADRTGRIVFVLLEHTAANTSGYDRVTAAFTIDLATLEAAPSTDAEIKYCFVEPLIRATPEEVRETALNFNRPFSEGWYTEKPCVRWQENGGENGYRLVFYGPEDNTDLLSLNCYVDGDSVKRACSYSRAELNELYPGSFTVGDGDFMDESFGNAKWYSVDGYSYMDMNRESGDSGFDFTERFGRNYRRVVFFIPASALNLDDDPEQLENALAEGRVGFELTSGPDNLLIFGDVAQAAEQERQESTEAYRRLCRGETPAEENQEYAGWVKDVNFVYPPTPSSDYADVQEKNFILAFQFRSEVLEDLPLEAKFYMNDNLLRTVPLYPTEETREEESLKHPQSPNYKTLTDEYLVEVDTAHEVYDENGGSTTERLYKVNALFPKDGEITSLIDRLYTGFRESDTVCIEICSTESSAFPHVAAVTYTYVNGEFVLSSSSYIYGDTGVITTALLDHAPQPQSTPEPDISESQPEEETPAPYPDKLFVDPTPQPQPTPEPDRSEQPEA